MEFAEVVKKRRMTRRFTGQPVSAKALDRILEAARRGPSAGNTQGIDFVVLTRPALKRAVAQLCGEEEYRSAGFHPFISGAQVLIVPCTEENAYHRRYREPDKVDPEGEEIAWPVPYWFMDVGCAVMLLLLAVVNEGLAAGFAGVPNLEALRMLLGIPSRVTPMGVIAVGHPAPDKRSPSLARGRRPEEEALPREKW